VGDATVTDCDEKFGLNWHGKRRARQLALTPSTGTLRPCPEESVDWETTQNLFIEGDNLEVLKLLQKSYAGKVKMIYIDPPYNTGNDFVYPDDFRDGVRNYQELTGQVAGERKLTSNTESSGRFHTDWLNMMLPRLRAAHALLSANGAMVISIDDTEVGHLRLACDEVFGPENFIANLVWQKKYTRANDATFFSANHDHLLVYARSAATLEMGRVPRGDKQKAAYANPDNHPKNVWKATPLHARSGSNTAPYTFKNGITWRPPKGTFRRFSDATMRELEADNAIWFGVDGQQTPSRKSFLSEMDDGMVPVTIWEHAFAGHNHAANDELKALDLGSAFTSPKPTLLIRRLLEILSSPSSNDLIVDFFAGSGTTGDAVVSQNAIDGGNRRYLLVQLPEPLDHAAKGQGTAADYCNELGKPPTLAELTKERLRRSNAKLLEAQPMFSANIGFRVFKLDSSNIREWEPSREDIAESLEAHVENLRADRTEQDILYELLLKRGLDLCVPIETREIAGKAVHSIGGGSLIVCLAESITREDGEALALGIVGWHKDIDPAGETAVIFRDAAFADDVVKTNVAAILEQNGLKNVRSI